MPKRKYEVTGTDDLGDVHTFATDDRERAEEIKAIMSEDLADMELDPEFLLIQLSPEKEAA